ncbi:MAG: FHA domain-containing protein [Deltaproteobacteria bacterium]|nr:FHA domain-containing protein [Deltaproteobacteria bacterium]
MAKLALRFISGKYKGKEHILEDGKETVIGRSSDADVVLMEDMVSRRHTLMMVNGDEVKVTDNGSTNGTFVNGEKISTTTAVKGDRILIGTSS